MIIALFYYFFYRYLKTCNLSIFQSYGCYFLDSELAWSSEHAVIGFTAWWLHAYRSLLYMSDISCHVFDDLFSLLFPTLCQCSFKLVAHWCRCKPVSAPHDWPAQVWCCIGWMLHWTLYTTTMLLNTARGTLVDISPAPPVDRRGFVWIMSFFQWGSRRLHRNLTYLEVF